MANGFCLKYSEGELEIRWLTVQNLLHSIDIVQEDKDQLEENFALVKRKLDDRTVHLEKSLELVGESFGMLTAISVTIRFILMIVIYFIAYTYFIMVLL